MKMSRKLSKFIVCFDSFHIQYRVPLFEQLNVVLGRFIKAPPTKGEIEEKKLWDVDKEVEGKEN